MKTCTRLALVALATVMLGGCGTRSSTTAEAPPSPGQRLYVANCLSCHQRDGAGVAGVQPPLAGTPVPTGDADTLIRWVLFGDRPAALPRGAYSGVMPQFGYLADADVAALLTYVRGAFGNHAEPITPEMVAAARAAHAAR